MPEAHADSLIFIAQPEGDLTGLQDRTLTMGSAAGRVRLANAGDNPVGTFRGFVTIESVQYAVVRLWVGIIYVYQSAAITPNSPIKLDASGKVVTSGSGDNVLGWKVTETAGIADDKIRIFAAYKTAFNPPGSYTGASASSGGTTGLVPAPAAGDQNKFLRADGSWQEGTNVPLPHIKETWTKPGHGLAEKNIVRLDGEDWVKAQADSATNAKARGVVESVDGDNVTIVLHGSITLSGLTTGENYLSAATAGALTDTAPSGDGEVVKSILWAASATEGYVSINPDIAESSGSGILQVVNSTPYTTYSSHSSKIPFDDTIPQNTEGDQIFSEAFTPKSATSKLILELSIPIFEVSSASAVLVAAFFKDSVTDAVFTGVQTPRQNGYYCSAHFRAVLDSGSTDEATYKVRIGRSVTGTLYLNGNSSGRRFGGSSKIEFSITEVESE